MLVAAAKALHHAAAHQAPAQRSHHFPEHDRERIDAAAGRFVTGEQFLTRAEAADRLVDLAEAPGIDADPSEVLHRVAKMRELPVQHGANAVGTDDEVAVPEIAVHQRYFLGRTGV